MHKNAHPSGGVDSSNPCRWRDGWLCHHGDGVCKAICAFCAVSQLVTHQSGSLNGVTFCPTLACTTPKSKDGTIIDFMALTMIDPASSWFEIVQLPLVHRLKTNSVNCKEFPFIKDTFAFDKSSNPKVQSFNKIWLSRYQRC
jgi:hypothetical protein